MRSTSLLLSLSLLCLFAASGWCQETETAAQDAAAASPPADNQDAKAEDATDDQDAEEDSTPAQIDNSLFGGLRVRLIGPALMSGRVGDLAVNPDNFDQIYAAACSGGVWKQNAFASARINSVIGHHMGEKLVTCHFCDCAFWKIMVDCCVAWS